ncbi:MAG TPA: L-threonylcarbamoyladenylate synthase [Nitrososphaera sp.]|jgi:L-threonylcarbamoyladenylate synthase
MPTFKTIPCTESGISECSKAIKNGAVVVFPTDTVYGIGCDPANEAGVKRIFEIKGRDEKKPLPLLVHDISIARKLVSLGNNGELLAKEFWPGALTIVAPLIAGSGLSPTMLAGSNSVALRVPAGRCINLLLSKCRQLVGTSANISGKKSPVSAQEVVDSGLDGFQILLDGGRVEKGIESTIVDATSGRVVREGAIKSPEIYRVIGSAAR